jgi:hypothetical protein
LIIIFAMTCHQTRWIKQKTNPFYPGANVAAKKKVDTKHEFRSDLDRGSGKTHIYLLQRKRKMAPNMNSEAIWIEEVVKPTYI